MLCRSLMAAAALALAATGFADDPINGGTFVGEIRLYDSYGSTGGGEFRVETNIDTSTIWSGPFASTGTTFEGGVLAHATRFETFCVEAHESVGLGGKYKVALSDRTFADDSDYTGGAFGGAEDLLDARTAYLYTNFIRKSLVTSYDYAGGGRTADANALQLAIWAIEEEISVGTLAGKALALFNEAQAAVAIGGSWFGKGIGNVRVMNLYRNTAEDHFQSQLTLIPIPAPLGLALAGFAGVGYITRRRRLA